MFLDPLGSARIQPLRGRAEHVHDRGDGQAQRLQCVAASPIGMTSSPSPATSSPSSVYPSGHLRIFVVLALISATASSEHTPARVATSIATAEMSAPTSPPKADR